MSEVSSEGRAWLANHVFGPDPCPRPTRHDDEPIRAATSEVSRETVRLDEPRPDPAEPAVHERDPNTGARRAAAVLVALFAVAIIVIVGTLTGWGGDDPAAAPPAAPLPAPVAPVAAPSSTPPPADQDAAIRYTASANCPAGSTSAAALTDARTAAAWICVRGQSDARVDGQVLHVDLGGSYVISGVSVTPGWVATTPGQPDEWAQHRVVSRLQYVFDDADRTVFTQDTGEVHGPVATALPTRVLASKVTVVVLHTVRPPTSPPADPETTQSQAGFGDSVLGAGGVPPPVAGTATTDPLPPTAEGDDPVDATFAVSALSFFGHRPR